jgi:putative cardiolipin synthase
MRAKRIVLAAASLAAILGGVDRCNALPPLEGRTPSCALTDTAGTRLGRGASPPVAAHPGLSGIYAMPDATDAFAARYLLASAAERTLDVQYYIWRDDLSGTLLMKALVDAADRSVRVRLLLDDNNTSPLDDALAALDAHPRIEVRLFNPFAMRTPRFAGYLTEFPRLNRRMHNKSFTADNQVTIIGGRNVGDEYFGATDGVLFADLDVLAIGPVVREVSNDFDRYWSSDSAFPASLLLAPAKPDAIAAIYARAARVQRDRRAAQYMDAVKRSTFVGQIERSALPLEWAATRMISDPPEKVLGHSTDRELLPAKLRNLFGQPARELDLVSPYFVPGTHGVEAFASLTRRGVRVRVLTNALEATDVPIVHAGYAKRRRALLQNDVNLWELRSVGDTRPPSAPGFGSSGASLHAKTFAVDRARIFVGSFNFDPRSAELNTEIGFVIESPALARRLSEAFDGNVPVNAYELRLARDGIQWVERRGKTSAVHDAEPRTPRWKRIAVALLSALPIEPLL